ncbi:dual specificity protein phosphatase family protein [Thalassotalea sp. G2M2-11]|uniref:dual specificity protein phosphatase family protein n=1 Tax=Thalassotalea sp. G2M2-11 TaxID=2787627 RepID=UPI0019CFAD76|nr:dual specificity protein phosphatase family protein [Thalassotalea sp. G2M2-11]
MTKYNIQHPTYPITLPNKAQIILTPCPGSQRVDIVTSIKQLKLRDTTILLTLMFDKEMTENNLQSLPTLCKQQDITWLQLPIIDDDIPRKPFEDKWALYQQKIIKTLDEGGNIAIHCKGGTGRTGLVAAMILMHNGWSIEKTIKSVRQVRPNALQIEKQLSYLYLD